MSRIRLAGIGLALVVAAGSAALWWAGRRAPDALVILDPAEESRRAGGLFAGSRACRDCHPGEYAAYSASGHARTLSKAGTSAVAARLDGREVEDPEYPGVLWRYEHDGARLVAERRRRGHEEAERFVLDYLLGSARHAGTFVSLIDPASPTSVEHRMTYYAADDSLAVTPGQLVEDALPGRSPHGRVLSSHDTLRCFGCHATPADEPLRTAAGRAPVAEPGRLLPNVSCERCHGAGRSHVEAARTGRGTLAMAFGIGPAAATAAAELLLCGQCHRHPARFPRSAIKPDDPSLARFQPIGLSQSACYRASEGALRCSTCHDPHARASTDRDAYERTCLGCHDGQGRTPCPLGRASGCIDCHMPRVDSGQGLLFADHWIRTRPRAAPAPSR